MNLDKIKIITDLTLAKVSILKLKADEYTWNCFVNEVTKKQLLDILIDIDKQLLEINNG